MERLDTAGTVHACGQQAIRSRRDLQKLAGVPHRQADRAPQPEQILGPMAAFDQAELLPALLAEAGFVPGLVGQAGNIEVGPGVVLRAAQRRHAGIGEPRALLPLLGLVEQQDVADAGAHQAEADCNARLTGADDENIQRRLAIRPDLRVEPCRARMRDHGEIGANIGFELCQRVTHAASQPPSTAITVPVVNEDASLARCSAVCAISSAWPKRFMAWRLREASRTSSALA